MDDDHTNGDRRILGLIPNDDFVLTESMRRFGLAENRLFLSNPPNRQRLAKAARAGDKIIALGNVEFTTLERLLYTRNGVEMIGELEISND